MARSLAELSSAFDTCWDSIIGFGGELSEDQWNTQSLCPKWLNRQVLTHLAMLEDSLHGWEPVAEPGPFGEQTARYWADHEKITGTELLAAFQDAAAARRDDLAGMDEAHLDKTSWTPFGVHTYGRFLEARVFDHWVHEQDMRVPVGSSGHLDGLAAEIALDEVHQSLGYIVGRKAGYPDGKSVTIETTGSLERAMHVRVDGRAAVVEALDSPDAVLRMDFLAFMLQACGRVDPQLPFDRGEIELAGDTALAEQLARNLAFTM